MPRTRTHTATPKPKPTPAFLSLHRATFRLGDRLVFEDSSWVFARDQHWAVIGANGSGKSLLGDALRGRLPLVHGELRYHFRPPPGLTPEESIGHVSFEDRRASIGEAVTQSRWNSLEIEDALKVSQFLEYKRVMDINPFDLTPRPGRSKLEFARRRARAVRTLDLTALLDRRLISLSNGETQRVQLARALCRPLRMLILDEPFTGLDSATRRHLNQLLEQLMRTSLRLLVLSTSPDDLPQGITHILRIENCLVHSAGQLPVNPRPRRAVASLRRPAALTQPALLQRAELVSLRNLNIRYGRKIILSDVTWTVYAGESWALLGPNGSGKSTLLSVILGDHPQAFANEIRVFGRARGPGESIWALKRQIGYVSPELHLHFDTFTTCLDTVLSGFHDSIGLFDPVTLRQRRLAREWLARFGLLESASEPLFTLSVGLQRLVLLARALVKRPRLLLLDEPCQGLDQPHRDLIVATIDSLIRHDAETAIYVTHRPGEIPASIRRTLRLDAGRVVLQAAS